MTKTFTSWCALGASLLIAPFFSPRPVSAQEPTAVTPATEMALDAHDVSPGLNPEIWLYLQELRRYDDPKQAVRRKAEVKSAQRRQRMASLAWYGYSASRPQASPVPTMGTAAPAWSGNTYDPYRWASYGYYAPVRVYYHSAHSY